VEGGDTEGERTRDGKIGKDSGFHHRSKAYVKVTGWASLRRLGRTGRRKKGGELKRNRPHGGMDRINFDLEKPCQRQSALLPFDRESFNGEENCRGVCKYRDTKTRGDREARIEKR